jgi:hypothetical protein
MTAAELQACGIVAQPLLAVIRAKCLDCVGHNAAEVRRCGDITCANWARMSANPFRAKRQLTEVQRVALKQARAAALAICEARARKGLLGRWSSGRGLPSAGRRPRLSASTDL